MFNKKFKTKVKYFGEGKYTVSYAYYRFIPIYHSLYFWFDQGVPGGTECWSTELLSISGAERLAKRLRSIGDVKEWYKPDEKRRKNFYRARKEFYKKDVPYRSKTF